MDLPEIKLWRYRHYKGKEYQVLGIAIHSESLEPHVLYQACYSSTEFGENAQFIRPYSMFIETVDRDGIIQPRFAHLG